MWYLIIGIVLFFWIYQIDKRSRRLEAEIERGRTRWISINARNAVIYHPRFAELTGIKLVKGAENKGVKKWTKEITDKTNRAMIHVAYLPSEDAFFVGSPNYPAATTIAFRDSTSNLLYSAVVAGDEDMTKPHLEFLVYERLIKTSGDKRQWVLTPCIRYAKSFLATSEHEFQSLCDFPLFVKKDLKSKARELGFNAEDYDPDFGPDRFGEQQTIPGMMLFTQNDVEISKNY